MKSFFICTITLCLFACNENKTHLETRVATRDEMIAYYNKMNDDEIRRVFIEQNIGQCFSEFQKQQIPNAGLACNCVMNDIARQMSILDLKTMLLPAEYVSGHIIHDISSRSNMAMLQAVINRQK